MESAINTLFIEKRSINKWLSCHFYQILNNSETILIEFFVDNQKEQEIILKTNYLDIKKYDEIEFNEFLLNRYIVKYNEQLFKKSNQ